jgi:hypothetical protein
VVLANFRSSQRVLVDDMRAVDAPMVEHAQFNRGKNDEKQGMGLVGGKCRYDPFPAVKVLDSLCVS